MDKPQLGYSCPQGLEYLAILDKLTVQKKLELVESKSHLHTFFVVFFLTALPMSKQA